VQSYTLDTVTLLYSGMNYPKCLGIQGKTKKSV